MLYRIVIKLFTRHMLLHLLIPLSVGAIIEALVGLYKHENLQEHFFEPERAISLGGIILTYWSIMAYLIYKETSEDYRKLQLIILEKSLETATTYFAVSTMRLREWFHPYMQAYLSVVVRRRYEPRDFCHQRVMFFFTEGDYKDASLPYLDGYYVKALREIHINYGIPVAFLKRDAILNIIKGLSFEDKKTLGIYPRMVRWLPDVVIKKSPLGLMRRRFPELDFAFVRHQGDRKSVFPFKKKGENVEIEEISDETDPEMVALYEGLMDKIKEKVLDKDGNVKTGSDFTKDF